MLPISILEKTVSSILYELPAGKPNPREKCGGEEARNRVVQSACKGNTCWYYVFNLIRRRIGKEPSEKLSQERAIEKLCSARRKAHTKHEASLPAITAQLHTQIAIKTLSNINLENAKFYIENRKIIQPLFETPQVLKGSPSLFPFIEEFVKEGKCKNMHEFLLIKKLKARNDINIKFLSNFNVTPEQLFALEFTAQNGYGKMSWGKLDSITQGTLLDHFVRDVSAKAYGLQKSSWTPLKGIDGLINALKENGPLFIGGALGQPVYEEQPLKMNQKLAERDIYTWGSGAKRHPVTFKGHAVLLIGAKKIQGEAFVYFIDPTDPSDPQDKSKQKIYMISFAHLTSNICDLHGFMRPDSSVPYAYHGKFKI